MEDEEIRTPVLSKNELFELSAAPVPSNPDTLNVLIQRMLDSNAAECGIDEEEDMNTKEMETALAEAKKELDTERSKSEVLEKRCEDLETERSKQQHRADEYEKVILGMELKELIGKKITADEVPGLLDIALANRELYDKQLAAIKARPDMNIVTDETIVGDDPNPPGKSAQSLNDRVNARR